MPKPVPNHVKGLLITALGVLILGPDTLFLRLIDEPPWMVLLWRGCFMLFGFLIIAKWHDPTPLTRQIISIGKPGLLMAACFAASSLCFVNAVYYTTVANTLVIISAAPMVAALLGWVIYKEPIFKDSIIAMLLVMVGVALVVQSKDEGHWIGDLCAAGTAVFIALTFLISRVKQDLRRFPAMAFAGLFLLVISLWLANPFNLKPESIPYIIVLGFITTTAFALLIIGPRYLPAHEVSLMMPLETVFGVLLVWWILDEVPSTQTLIGGALVLATLAGFAFRRAKSNNP